MPLVGPIPLFAAGLDWLEGLLPFVFVVFWLVAQGVNLIRRIAGEPARPRVEPVALPRRPPPAADPGGGIDDVRADLERQIEEFLGRSRGGRTSEPEAATSRRQEPRPPRPPASRPVPPRTTPAGRNRSGPPPLPAAAPASVATRHLEPLGTSGDDVAEHVQDAFKRRLSHLESALTTGSEIDTAGGPRAITRPAGSDLAEALRDPATARRLILMREVFDRPVERWE